MLRLLASLKEVFEPNVGNPGMRGRETQLVTFSWTGRKYILHCALGGAFLWRRNFHSLTFSFPNDIQGDQSGGEPGLG